MRKHFTVYGEPKGKGRPRFRRVGNYTQTYTPDETVSYENLIQIEYERQCEGYRFDDGDFLDLRIYAYYKIPKKSKKITALMQSNLIRPTKKPDMDNVIKVVADALNKVAYKDDAQIVDTMVRKFYSDRPRIEIIIQNAKEITTNEEN